MTNQLGTILKSFNDMEFYNSETFTTVTDYIFTFEEEFQLVIEGEEVNGNQFCNVGTTNHSIDATSYEIQRDILKTAINFLSEDEKSHLVKVSSCTHYTDKYEDDVSERIKEGCDMFMGKWYFQPDQRRRTENELILEDPIIAKYTKRFDEKFPIKPSHVTGEMS